MRDKPKKRRDSKGAIAAFLYEYLRLGIGARALERAAFRLIAHDPTAFNVSYFFLVPKFPRIENQLALILANGLSEILPQGKA